MTTLPHFAMSDNDSKAPTRNLGSSIVKPIIVGTYATMFSQQEIARRRSRNDSATHRWSCIVRAPSNEDTSYFIRKVVITLHPTFSTPQKVFDKPPYEVREVGWGEFDISVRFYFVDVNERPVDLKHRLKLYPSGVEDFERYCPPEGQRNCMVAETYDEFFFIDPAERFHDVLINGPIHPVVRYADEEHFLKSHGKEEYIAGICAAEAVVNKTIELTKEKIISLILDIERMKRVYYAANETKAISIIRKEIQK